MSIDGSGSDNRVQTVSRLLPWALVARVFAPVPLVMQNFPNEISFQGSVRLPIIPADAREAPFQFRIPFPNRGPMPQQIAEAKVIPPLAASVFHNVKMDGSDVREGIYDE